MKKILWIIGGLFFAFFIAVISIPLFVDVDQYRPQITSEAQKYINGKLELGKLKLSLWGAVKIHAESIRLSVNGFSEPLLDAKQFHLELPFSSILAGSPQVVAVLENPKISLLKDSAGQSNYLMLLKKSDAPQTPDQASAPVSDGQKKPEQSVGSSKIPALLVGSTLGFRVHGGEVSYLDRVSKTDYRVKGLEAEAQNIGLGSSMQVRVTAPMEGKMPGLQFSGPVTLSVDVVPLLVGTTVKSVKGKVDVDATQMAIDMPGKFQKKSSTPLLLKLQVDGEEKETLIRQAELRLNDMKFYIKGRVVMDPLRAKLDFNTDVLQLEQWASFFPSLQPYELKGALNLNSSVDWTPQVLRLNGDLKIQEGAFFFKDVFLTPVRFQLQAGFSENTFNLVRGSVGATDSDLQLVGNVKNFLSPQFSLSVSGKSLNLEKLLRPAPVKSASVWIPEAMAAPDENPLLAFASNPVLLKAAGNFSAQIGKVVSAATVEQLVVKGSLQNLQLKLQEIQFKIFGGTMKSTADFDLKSPNLRYSLRGSGKDVSGKAAFVSYFPKLQNTFDGNIDADWNLSGAFYPAAGRLRSMKGTTKIVAKDGSLKSVDFQESINSVMQKVPFLKGKNPVKVDSGFKTLSTSLVFDAGTVRADPIEMQPKNRGFMVKGKSLIQESLQQETFFDIFDPQGQLPKEFHVSGKPALALRLYGPLNAPSTDYEYTVKKLASTAGANVVKEAAGKALDKFLGGKKEGDPLKDAADKLKKKFKLF